MQLVANTLRDGRLWAAVMLLAVTASVLWIWLSFVPAAASTGGLIPSPREGFLA